MTRDMRRSLRYALALLVGLTVGGGVFLTTREDVQVTFALPILYGVTTSLAIAHRDTLLGTSLPERSERKSRIIGVLSAGVGSLTVALLVRVSLPAAVAGIGLMAFGVVFTTAGFASMIEE